MQGIKSNAATNASNSIVAIKCLKFESFVLVFDFSYVHGINSSITICDTNIYITIYTIVWKLGTYRMYYMGYEWLPQL